MTQRTFSYATESILRWADESWSRESVGVGIHPGAGAIVIDSRLSLAGVVGQLLIEGVAQVPPVREMEIRRLDELALGADTLEEHDQLQFEEVHGIDAGAAALGVDVTRPLPDEAQIERRLEVAVEVVPGDELLKRDDNRFVKAEGLGRAEYERVPERGSTRERRAVYRSPCRRAPPVFQQAGRLSEALRLADHPCRGSRAH